jgi:transcriptional regulator with XRE-family HTH domain
VNYTKIKTELENRGITVKDFCRDIGITEQGFYQMFRNRSMKVDVLERISDELQVPVAYWFDEQGVGERQEEARNVPPPVKKEDKDIAKRIDEITDGLKFLLNQSLNRK